MIALEDNALRLFLDKLQPVVAGIACFTNQSSPLCTE